MPEQEKAKTWTDDPLNQDGIGKREILVVSFGTSFKESRIRDIGGVERVLAQAFPTWSIRRAFTSGMILRKLKKRDGLAIDGVEEALDRAQANGVEELLVQPTHLIQGGEYHFLLKKLKKRAKDFASIRLGLPLLGETGDDPQATNPDKKAVVQALVQASLQDLPYQTIEEAGEDGLALVLMGHGSNHEAHISYQQMQAQVNDLGWKNVFVGTVEGPQADQAFQDLVDRVQGAGYKQVILRPLMLVAGDHANNDMAGDQEDSWKNQFLARGAFDRVDCQVEGMGGLEAIQEIFIRHVKEAHPLDV